MYFNLVNLFGEVPLVTTTEWAKVNLASKASVEEVYKQIIADLQEAINLLPDNLFTDAGNRIRANRWAAKALMARVFYTGRTGKMRRRCLPK